MSTRGKICKVCKSQMSVEAETCPRCGSPDKKTSKGEASDGSAAGQDTVSVKDTIELSDKEFSEILDQDKVKWNPDELSFLAIVLMLILSLVSILYPDSLGFFASLGVAVLVTVVITLSITKIKFIKNILISLTRRLLQ